MDKENNDAKLKKFVSEAKKTLKPGNIGREIRGIKAFIEDARSGSFLPSADECTKDINDYSKKIKVNEGMMDYGTTDKLYRDNRNNFHILGLAYLHRGGEGDFERARLAMNKALELPRTQRDYELADTDEDIFDSLKWNKTINEKKA